MNCLRCSKPCDPNDDDHRYCSEFCSLRCATLDWRDFSGVPGIFFDTDLSKLPAVQVAHVAAWVKERNCRRGNPGLLLHGTTSGTGKTRLGTYAFNTLALQIYSGRESESDCGPTGRWYNVARFISTYRRLLREHEAKAEWQEDLQACEVLFLDDLDKCRPSEGLMELIYAVLDDRLSFGRHTILTTNLCGDALAQNWGDEIGPYLVRRLREFAVCVDFDVQTPANVLTMEAAS